MREKAAARQTSEVDHIKACLEILNIDGRNDLHIADLEDQIPEDQKCSLT